MCPGGPLTALVNSPRPCLIRVTFDRPFVSTKISNLFLLSGLSRPTASASWRRWLARTRKTCFTRRPCPTCARWNRRFRLRISERISDVTGMSSSRGFFREASQDSQTIQGNRYRRCRSSILFLHCDLAPVACASSKALMLTSNQCTFGRLQCL